MTIEILDEATWNHRLHLQKNPAHPTYLAMYSSWVKGITKDPALMVVPVDDHIVHRGDGIFEAIKTVGRKIFLLDAHLNRLEASAKRIGLELPMSRAQIQDAILATLRAANIDDSLIRLYVSRGPGGFSTNPYESVGAQLYIVITTFKSFPAEKYKEGVKIGISKVPVKEGWFPQVKSCNYLPNVLMKKESVDRGLDLTISVTKDGLVAEGSTENIVMVSKDGVLTHPRLDYILRGTTMIRVFELAKNLVSSGLLKGIEERDIPTHDLMAAREAMFIGTTLDVLPVLEVEGKNIGDKMQRPVATELLKLLRADFPKGTPF